MSLRSNQYNNVQISALKTIFDFSAAASVPGKMPAEEFLQILNVSDALPGVTESHPHIYFTFTFDHKMLFVPVR